MWDSVPSVVARCSGDCGCQRKSRQPAGTVWERCRWPNPPILCTVRAPHEAGCYTEHQKCRFVCQVTMFVCISGYPVCLYVRLSCLYFRLHCLFVCQVTMSVFQVTQLVVCWFTMFFVVVRLLCLHVSLPCICGQLPTPLITILTCKTPWWNFMGRNY